MPASPASPAPSASCAPVLPGPARQGPPPVLGVLGGGQLGRMFVHAAQALGYETVVLDPDANSPAGRVSQRFICAPYDRPEALREMAELACAITTEFENVPAATKHWLKSSPCMPPKVCNILWSIALSFGTRKT